MMWINYCQAAFFHGFLFILINAGNHKGTSVVEILQNCIIYNDNTHSAIVDKEFRDDRQLWLEHGKPMIFGKENEKGIVLDGLKLEVVNIGENGITEKDLLVHDAHSPELGVHNMLVNMELPEFPVAFGVIRAVESMVYEDALVGQINENKSISKIKNVDDLLNSGKTWKVE